MPSYRRLQQYAIGISIISILYNGAEAAVSVGLGSESSSRSLIFFGVQSGIEVISASIVVWRFKKIAQPGEEKGVNLGAKELRIEKFASASIGLLLIGLSLATEISAIIALSLHQEPDASNVSLIVSATALVLMVAIWLPKRYLARALNSSAMAGEATCSLSCIQITIVLFVGSLIFRLWRNGWWVDSATSLILGALFGWEGYKMIKWVRDPNFDGGCCKECLPSGNAEELGESYKDLCGCCTEKIECKTAGECKCGGSIGEESHNACCVPSDMDGSRCCTHRIIKGTRPVPLHTEVVTSGQLSCTQTAELTRKGCCSTKAIGDAPGGACCSIAPTVKDACSNESTSLPFTTLSSTCCAESPCSNESTYLTTLPSTCCAKSPSTCANESIKLPSTTLPSTCCAK